MSDYLSRIAARRLNQVKVILPRIASRYEPVDATGFAIYPFTGQVDLRGKKAFSGENIDSFGHDLETEAIRSSRRSIPRDRLHLPSVFRPQAIERAIKFSVSQADEKSPPSNASLEPKRSRRSTMSNLGPVPIRSRMSQNNGNSAKSNQCPLIKARSREISALQAALPGSSRRGDFHLKRADLLRIDSSNLHRPSIIAASQVAGPEATISRGQSSAMQQRSPSLRPELSRDLSLSESSDSSKDVMLQTQQSRKKFAVTGWKQDDRSIPGAEAAIDQGRSLDDGFAIVRESLAQTIENSSRNAGDKEQLPLIGVRSVEGKTITVNSTMKSDQMGFSPSGERLAQNVDHLTLLPGSHEGKEWLFPAKDVSPQIIVNASEQGSVNPDLRVESPEIQVTIGRIEIRATPQAATAQQRRPSPNLMSLNEYLRQRAGGDGK